jgi:hypothetical protein
MTVYSERTKFIWISLSTKVLLNSISILVFGANIARKMAFRYSQNQNRQMYNKHLQESRL